MWISGPLDAFLPKWPHANHYSRVIRKSISCSGCSGMQTSLCRLIRLKQLQVETAIYHTYHKIWCTNYVWIAINRILKTPTEDIWPGVTCLPDYKETFPCWTSHQLNEQVHRAQNIQLIYPHPSSNILTNSVCWSTGQKFERRRFGIAGTDAHIQSSQPYIGEENIGAQIFRWIWSEIGADRSKSTAEPGKQLNALIAAQRVNDSPLFLHNFNNNLFILMSSPILYL